MSEKKLYNISGIFIFVISLLTYYLTLEPANSYWDCSEFISCAYHLEVGHAPGAPMFMLLGRFFSLFASDSSHVAFMINLLSAVASAATVMFLFWIIVWFGKKLINKSSKKYSYNEKSIIIYASASIGALSFAFSDSFWFSAVEGEVYACSSFFSAIVIWAILRWEESEEGWKSTRWILLIFYLMGLSVGIHLLNLLTLPAIALVFYCKKYKPNIKGTLLAIFTGFLIVIAYIFIIIPGIASLAAYTDLLFVNSFKLPVYTGAVFFIIILFISLFVLYRYSVGAKKILLKTITLAFTLWVIGYSSFIVLVIRSNSNPFIDINNVENIFGLVDYLNREQYPQRPLFYGNNFNSPIVDSKKRFTYKYYNGQYVKDDLNPEYIYDNKTLTLFPRMASTESGHVQAYQNWVDIKGREVKTEDGNGNIQNLKIPTFGENIRFFVNYQLGHMYFRYFLWNFSGRQDDVQGYGGQLHGNWITGIPFIDKQLIGNQNKAKYTSNSQKSRNSYYLLPLLLGLTGFFFQYKKDKYNFISNLMLFLFTGIAIVVYLNEVPITPRERDYAYVGSFFAFSIWIGLGCLAIMDGLRTKKKNQLVFAAISTVLFVLVPFNMFKENFDDHNRSNRYTARDYAKNMLESCEKNAIMFTTADNDTYPIWYIQEVEGFRRDVRQILEPFLPIDWYANQLNQSFSEKQKLNFSFHGEELLMNKNQYFPVLEKIDSAIDLSQAIEFVREKDPRTKVKTADGDMLSFIPGKKIVLPVNKSNFIKSCKYANLDSSIIPREINFEIKKQYLSRDELFLLDILVKNDWKRPVYFASTDLLEQVGLSEYAYREGILYRFLPFKKDLPAEFARQQALYQYSIIKDKFKWGNVNSENVYLDYVNIQMIAILQYNQIFAGLAKKLVSINENEKAGEILDLAINLFPIKRIGYSYSYPEIIESYYLANKKIKADYLTNEIAMVIKSNLEFFAASENKNSVNNAINEIRTDLYILQQLQDICSKHSHELQTQLSGIMESNYPKFKDLFKEN